MIGFNGEILGAGGVKTGVSKGTMTNGSSSGKVNGSKSSSNLNEVVTEGSLPVTITSGKGIVSTSLSARRNRPGLGTGSLARKASSNRF